VKRAAPAALALAWGLSWGLYGGAAAAQPLLSLSASTTPRDTSCRALPSQVPQELTLLAVVEHVLCKSPLVNQALLLVDEQRAGVDLAQSAFRPRFSASAELSSNRVPSNDSSLGSLSHSVTGSLGMNWVLWDGGLRDANLAQSRQQLDSARAAQQNAALATVNEALRLYVEAAVAWARLDTSNETEAVARQSLEAVRAKHAAQVASLSERLQAETALAQATLDRVRADGAWDTARGLLSVAMGFSADAPLTLAPISSAFPSITAQGPLGDWIAQARREHPRVRGARADVQALKARVDAVRAESRGTLQAGANVSTTRDLGIAGGKFETSLSGYVIASVPLFNQYEQRARESQAQAQVASREAALEQVERDIESDLWRTAKLLETESQNLKAAKMLLYTATQSYQITYGRYRAGVGSILELISTQVALSAAHTQVTQAQLGHAQARLRLDVAAGRVLFSR